MQIRLKNCENTKNCGLLEDEARELLRELVMYPDVTSWLKAMFNKKSLYVPTNVTVITDTAVYEPITVACDDPDVPYWNFDDDAFKAMMHDLKRLPDEFTDFPSDTITIDVDIDSSELDIHIPSSIENTRILEIDKSSLHLTLIDCMETNHADQLLRFLSSNQRNLIDLVEFSDPETSSLHYLAADTIFGIDGNVYTIRRGGIEDADARNKLMQALQALPPKRQKLISNRLTVYAGCLESVLMVSLD